MKCHVLVFIGSFFLLNDLKAQETHTITMVGESFTPQEITINIGDEVVWENASNLVHTSTSGTDCASDGIWDSGNLSPGGTFSRLFDSEGEFSYFCIPHCSMGMVGNIIVSGPNSTVREEARATFKIKKAFPNPADLQMFLEYETVKPELLVVEVVSKLGVVVKTFTMENQSGGRHQIPLDLSGISAGIYICRLSGKEHSESILISIMP